jgi:hypothetical protein
VVENPLATATPSRDHVGIEKSTACSVMNSSSAGVPSRLRDGALDRWDNRVRFGHRSPQPPTAREVGVPTASSTRTSAPVPLALRPNAIARSTL